MQNNIGSVSNTALENDSGPTTRQKVVVSGPLHHQVEEESLSHQEREIETRI